MCILHPGVKFTSELGRSEENCTNSSQIYFNFIFNKNEIRKSYFHLMLSIPYFIMVGRSRDRPQAIARTLSGSPIGSNISGLN